MLPFRGKGDPMIGILRAILLSAIGAGIIIFGLGLLDDLAQAFAFVFSIILLIRMLDKSQEAD